MFSKKLRENLFNELSPESNTYLKYLSNYPREPQEVASVIPCSLLYSSSPCLIVHFLINAIRYISCDGAKFLCTFTVEHAVIKEDVGPYFH